MAVAPNKNKLIEEAQKLVLRGQFDKAAKTYEQILALDPTAMSLRQKLAELLIKSGRNEDARKEFETIGKYFSKNGFYLKAIAVYKQLQKLFPADISLSLTLAELNEKHGLAANALSEYKLVYETYENAGNFTEALNILGRMQNVDPQNIPIKIKLAEAYFQQGKKNEAYAVFIKASALLVERSENAALSKICARVQQLFPQQPDFLFEVLSYQIQQGNASTAIAGLQSLLRNDPNNKSVWELIIQAYRLLDQPQRVKIAYQHYLIYFPAEPAAILGLISSIATEHDLAAAIEMLDQYEISLISGGFIQQLEEIYHVLDKLDPINTRIIEGLTRLATAAGNKSEVELLSSKLKSLQSISVRKQDIFSESQSSAPFLDEELPVAFEDIDRPFFEDTTSEPATTSDSGGPGPMPESMPTSDLLPDFGFADAETATAPLFDDEIEIEIDVDSPFDLLEEDSSGTSTGENWLDSVGALFDTISTAPRGVKFDNEMDNSDAQSHFDLGQAFKEMGLYDEAINEFRQASQDPSLLVECLIMQCVCLRERGEFEKATTMLQALLKPGLGLEESCSVKYELATGYEIAGRTEEARLLLNEINSTNPGFRDISSRLNAANTSGPLDFSDDDLKDF